MVIAEILQRSSAVLCMYKFSNWVKGYRISGHSNFDVITSLLGVSDLPAIPHALCFISHLPQLLVR